MKNSNFWRPKAYSKYNDGIQIEREEKEETFKCCLNTMLCDDRMGEMKKTLINDRVSLVNRIAFDAWNFANMFILHCIENDVFDIPEMDVVFFELCIKSVTSCSFARQSKQHPEFKTVIAKYFLHLHKNKKEKGAGDDYRVSRDDISHGVNEIAHTLHQKII